MLSYWFGLLCGLLAVVAALAVITGIGLAAAPALLIVLVVLAGLDLPILAAAGPAVWRADISKASLPFSQTYLAGWSVYMLPFLAAWLTAALWPTFWGLLTAWLVLILGAVLCGIVVMGRLAAVARRKGHLIETPDR